MSRNLSAAVASVCVFVAMGACSSDPSSRNDGSGGVLASLTASPHTPPRLANGRIPGVVPFRTPGEAKVDSSQCRGASLQYFGGPLLQSPTIISVFWNSDVNSGVTANLPQFHADVTTGAYWQWLTEYDTVGRSPGTSQSILPGGAPATGVTLSPVLCTAGAGSCTLADSDIQTELTRQIGLSTLPPPSIDCTGNTNTIYMIDFPPAITVNGVGSTSCVGGGFCAYHSTGTYGSSNQPLVYGVVMDMFTGPCSSGCGGSTGLPATTSVHSHELVEAVTDADIGLDTGNAYQYPAGWGDNNCGEIGDICNGQDGTIVVSGRTWTVQQLWSNAQHNCVTSGSPLPVCTGSNHSGCRGCSCGDSNVACGGATPFCETTASSVDFGACEQCTSDPQCAAGNICVSSTSASTDDTCTPCGASGQPCCASSVCTAPDTCGGGGTTNVCGCTPQTSCNSGQCGQISDGCGGFLSCTACKATCGGLTFVASVPSPSPAGTSITFTADATCEGTDGGAAAPLYEFYLKAPGGSNLVQQAYSSTNTWTWSNGNDAPGMYYAEVVVSSVGDHNQTEASRQVPYTLEAASDGGAADGGSSDGGTDAGPPKCTSVTLTPSPTGPQAPGPSVIFTASATCTAGATPLYEFYLMPLGGSNAVQQGYSTANTWTWTTSAEPANHYYVEVLAHAQGTTGTQASRQIVYVLN